MALNRSLHRIGGLFVMLLMLWLGTTGSLIQSQDLGAIFRQAPQSDPTQLSMAEGMYGQSNYNALQLRDIDAPALPADLDIRQAIGTVLLASHGPRSEGEADLNPVAWVELRMNAGAPIGQVMAGTTLHAFDAQSGEPVAAVPPIPFPQGARLPPSLRQNVKILHRFWNRGDVPGVYFEFLSGLVLWTLLVTGLVMYFRLLAARAKIGRSQIFWLTGGKWRGLHRAVSVVAAAFLACMAFSGTWIGFESSWSALHRPDVPAPGVRRNPIDFIIPLRDGEVQAMTATTLDVMHRLHPGMPIKVIRLRKFGTMKQGVVIVGGERTNQLVFDAEAGEPASLSEPSYPRSNFPFGVQVHEDIKHFHSGEMFGVTGRLMNLFAGLSLVFLDVSGLVVYLQMWNRRRAAGRGGLLWKS